MLERLRELLLQRKAQPEPRSVKPRPPSFRAVSIRPGADCCSAASEISSIRFLVDEAPLLPLKTCSAAQCDCRYINFPDRRQAVRRVVDTSRSQQIGLDNDKRNNQGRRKEDHLFD